MTDKTEENENTFDLDVYNNLLIHVNSILLFEGKSLDQWTIELTLPSINEDIDIPDLSVLHSKANKLTEIVHSNLAIAKARLVGAKASYTKKVSVSEYNLRQNISNSDNKRMPSASIIENKAFNESLAEFQAQTICEIFSEFWKTQLQKLDHFNNRLTTLSYSVNLEKKLSKE